MHGRDVEQPEDVGGVGRRRAGDRGALLRTGCARAHRPGGTAVIHAGASGDMAGTLVGPRPGGARGGDAGVHRPWRCRLGTGAADESPVRGPPRLPRQHPRQDRGRSRCGQRRRRREAAGNDRRHQDRSGQTRNSTWTGTPLRGRAPATGGGLPRHRVAWSHCRSARHRRARDRARDLHAARAPRSARPADRVGRSRAADRDNQGVRRGGNARQPAAADAVAGERRLRHRCRRRVVLPRRALSAGVGRTRCGAAVHSVRGPRAWRGRADCGEPGRPPRLGGSALGGRHVRRARAVHEPGA